MVKSQHFTEIKIYPNLIIYPNSYNNQTKAVDNDERADRKQIKIGEESLTSHLQCSGLKSLSTIFQPYHRELNAHFYSAASLKYHAPDT